MNDVLVLSNHYLTFVKDQFEVVSQRFGNINVLVNFHSYYSFFPDKKIDLKNIPLNINILQNPQFYLHFLGQYKLIGERHFKFAQKLVTQNNLKFDLIHSHFTWPSGYVGAKLKEKYNVPFVVTAHGYDIYDLPFKDDEWRSKIEYVLNSADAIITVSNSNLECIKNMDVKTPVKVLSNGYREDLFHPIDPYESRKLLSIPSDKKVILSVGNLEEVKGHKYLIEAISHVVKRRKDVICFIVGGGRLKTHLKKQIKSAGLQDHVKLVGGKPHNCVPIWMNACDVFVLPSLRESFGIVQIEAMGCGKPIVATCNGGSEEIITSEDYGLLCEPANPKDMADKILVALDKGWDNTEIEMYARKFRWEEVLKDVIRIYRGLGLEA